MSQRKRIVATASLITLCLSATFWMSPMRSDVRAEEKNASERLLRHVVMFKFKDASSPAEVQKVVDAFGKLKQEISAIHDYEFGTNNSPEGLNDGFTHCFLVTFKSEKDREAYLPHPKHKAFVDILKPHLDKVMVIDYWAEG